MKIKNVLMNVFVWPLTTLVVFNITGLLIGVSWSQLLKVLPIFTVITIFYAYSIYSFIHALNEKEDLIISESKEELKQLISNANLSLQAYNESYELLKGLVDGRPIPSSRTGHEYLGNPKYSAKIMGAIPKNDSKRRVYKFLTNMKNGVNYKMIYLNEGSVKSGIKAYCKEFVTQIENKSNFSNVKVEEQFEMILVPAETIQMSFDIFDENDDDINRMLIHFPNIGVLHSNEFNHAWRIESTEVIRHYVNVFDVIWKKHENEQSIDILATAKKDMIVTKEK